MSRELSNSAPLTDRDVAIEAAEAGAAVIRRAFGRRVSPELKGAVNPVTEVDRAAEAVILEVISSMRPQDGILAEEGGGRTADGGRRWIVDPLDGTVNFVHAIPHVAVSVGLWDGDVAVAGAVVDVMRGEVFSAARGEGARLGGETIMVSSRARLSHCVVGTGFPYDRDIRGPSYTAVMGEVMTRVRDVRRLGSAALDFAWVACGRFDGFWEYGLLPWDVAAGLLLVEEAGGLSADLVRRPATVTSNDFILAAPGISERFIELIRSFAPRHVRALG